MKNTKNVALLVRNLVHSRPNSVRFSVLKDVSANQDLFDYQTIVVHVFQLVNVRVRRTNFLIHVHQLAQTRARKDLRCVQNNVSLAAPVKMVSFVQLINQIVHVLLYLNAAINYVKTRTRNTWNVDQLVRKLARKS